MKMCAETDSQLKTLARISLDEKMGLETVQSNSSLPAKSLLEDDEDDEPEEEKELLPSVEDDVRDMESDHTRGFAFEEPQFTPDFSGLSDPVLCSNYGLCTGPLFVNNHISDQIEIMTQCRHPMELFSMFHEHTAREGVESGIPMAYVVPTRCEYCGCESTKLCNDSCQRPKSLFRKKKPPFCPPGPEWDPRTEEEIKPPEKEATTESEGNSGEPVSPFLALSGFFTSPTAEQ